jgi:hypothetical protein
VKLRLSVAVVGQYSNTRLAGSIDKPRRVAVQVEQFLFQYPVSWSIVDSRRLVAVAGQFFCCSRLFGSIVKSGIIAAVVGALFKFQAS